MNDTTKVRTDMVPVVGGNQTTSGSSNDRNTTIHSKGAGLFFMKSVSMFLTHGRRVSTQKSTSQQKSNIGLGSKRRRRPSKMDEKNKLYAKKLEMLKKKTKFTKDELEVLSQIYKKLISNCKVSSRPTPVSSTSVIAKTNAIVEGIDRIVFRELMHSTFDIVTEETIIERMFCTWDKDHEGVPLRLEGWITGLSTFLRGTLSERAAFCFRVYDLNADGFITKDEMFTLLRNSLIKQPQEEDPDEGVRDLVEIVLKRFDLDKDGKVSFDDYFETVKNEPLLLEAFGQCLPSESATISFFSTLHL